MNSSPIKWHQGITRAQWLVLAIASAGWVFDAFEGQLFNLTRGDLLAELLHVKADAPEVKRMGDIFLGVFLVAAHAAAGSSARWRTNGAASP